ncbi:hypothetical protein F4777DRAFT_536065 [Nemania sp. FL0916]|nr:hypothetical protein F4777DRAFT_536065 [Nemania sp. FL0916]
MMPPDGGPYCEPDGGSYFDSDNNPYYVINGQIVPRNSSNRSPGSNREIAHSVHSLYKSHDYIESYDHVEPNYRYYKDQTDSHPPRVQPNSDPSRAPRSQLKSKMMSGFPAPYNAGHSQGSAPGDTSNDYFRNSVDEKRGKQGPPFDSDFCVKYNDYKDRDWEAQSAEDNYKAYRATAQKTSKAFQNQNPGVYMGNPKETEDWHKTAAQYAGRARDLYHE